MLNAIAPKPDQDTLRAIREMPGRVHEHSEAVKDLGKALNALSLALMIGLILASILWRRKP